MARTQTVWDADGREVTVRTVDAAEILAGGGSATDPNAVVEEVTCTEAEAIEQNDGVDGSTDAKAKGKKAK